MNFLVECLSHNILSFQLIAQNYELILLPLNDQFGGNRGVHWSLVLIDVCANTIHHFDSQGGNASLAEQFARKLGKGFNNFKFVEETCIKQRVGGNDCGVHLITNAHRILSGTEVLKPFDADETRRKIIN